MSRQSSDVVFQGYVLDGFDYALQVWVKFGIIEDCGHFKDLREKGCCNGHKLAGRFITDFPPSREEY